jgi:hypothetical protein
MTTEEETSIAKTELKSEAEALRRELAGKSQILQPDEFARWKKLVFAVLLFGVVAAAVFLLIFDGQRLGLLTEVAGVWLGRDVDESSPILKLPPPPPREAEARIRYPDTISYEGGEFSEFDGVLYSSSSDGDLGAAEEEDSGSQQRFVNPAKTEESQKAFEFLKENSSVAGQLADNTLEGYEWKEWKVIRDDPPIFLIDLISTSTSDDRDLHFVWEVDLETGVVRPLSQAARDLDGG